MLNLLLGRYHRPVAEERMFLDLNDSTAIAAALGPFRFNDGQIYQYVGDEAVVTWTVERGSGMESSPSSRPASTAVPS